MELKKLLMIVNPRAGRNKSRGPLFDAAATLSEAGYALTIHRTTGNGDAAETAAREGGVLTIRVDAAYARLTLTADEAQALTAQISCRGVMVKVWPKEAAASWDRLLD